MTGSAFANCLMYIDDFTVTPDQLGTVIELRVKALYSARLNSWSLDLTFPEGLTPTNAEPGADYDITYINSSGNTAIHSPIFYPNDDYTRIIGFAYEQGYWYDPNNGNALTSYGSVKWEVGTYEEMIVLYVRVSEDFRGGEIVLNSEFSSTDDARGGTIRDVYGQQAIDYTCVCTVTFGSPEAYACYTPSNTTLTFYYDEQRASRPGTTYSLNTGNNDTGWDTDGTKDYVTKVLFDPSFADARPTTTYDWFYKMQNLQSITGISYLNTSEVTNMAFMFHNCENLTSLDVSNFNTAKVTDMRYMFNNCSSLTTLDLSSFNTSNVTTMAHMFNGCYGLTSLDVSGFNTSNVTDMSYMFMWCEGLTTIYAGNGWNTNNVTNGSFMFYQCTRLVGGMGTTYDTNNTGVAYAHIDGGPSNPGYFSAAPEAYACYTESNTTFTFYYDNYRSSRQGTTYDLNVGDNQPAWPYDLYMNQSPSGEMPVTRVVFDPSFADARPKSTYYWFVGMLKLSSITGIEYLNTEKVTNMAYMFADCSSLTSIDVSNFNTAKVTDMSWLFSGCSGLTSLDLSNFNTAKVTDMYGMFAYDDKLATIVVGDGWNTSALTTSFYMFYECASLVGGMGTNFDENHIDAEYAHIDGGPSNPGYFTAKSSFLRGDVNGDGQVKISDVTALINYLLSGDASQIDLQAADCNEDGQIKISDVTSLINYLLSGAW